MTPAVVTVSELNRRSRRLLEEGFALLWVSGEVSNLTRAASGHVYFTLRDEGAQVRCAMFRNRAQLVGWQLANGQHVEVNARVTLYEARGDYQLGVEGMRRAGLGRLFEAFVRLREQLAAEGLFAPERKRPLPSYPRCIGIVTSPQAAALRDVLVALRRRAPHVPLWLYPTPVQGEAAPGGIAAALAAAAAHGQADVLLLVRGGGSMEDLWAFNEVQTARAVAACPIPLVSGVGHETDTTITDYVADLRAATPTAAAEIVSAPWLAAHHALATQQAHLQRAMQRRLDNVRQRLDQLGLRLVHPATRIARLRDSLDNFRRRLSAAMHAQMAQHEARVLRAQSRLLRRVPDTRALQRHLDGLALRLPHATTSVLASYRQRANAAASALAHLDPQRTVARGYAIVRNGQGQLVRDIAQLAAGDALAVQLARGVVDATVDALRAPPDTAGETA